MRKGINIAKNALLNKEVCNHRIIIPLYIPDESGYYKDSFRIFEMCLTSLLKTVQQKVKISVISNGCCKEVNEKLFRLHTNKLIDELIIELENIGKINSILKALRTAEERLITITDADVLFLNGWESEVIKVFKTFPKAGMVSPVPVFRTHFRYTSNIWMSYLFSEKLKFRNVKNPEAITRFANSLGWTVLHDKLKDTILTLKKENTTAVVGNSHFVGTYKREIFNAIPATNTVYKLGGSSEKLYTDLPVLRYGGFRLATYNNYAYHMGNALEPWIIEQYEGLKDELKKIDSLDSLPLLNKDFLSYTFSILFSKLFHLKIIKKYLLKHKGLNISQLNNFLEETYE